MSEPRSAFLRRWKLWHLATLVAVSAVVLAMEEQTPDGLLLVEVLGIFFVPACWAAGVWDRFVRRYHDEGLPPPPLYDKMLTRAGWSFLFLLLMCFVAFVLTAALNG